MLDGSECSGRNGEGEEKEFITMKISEYTKMKSGSKSERKHIYDALNSSNSRFLPPVSLISMNTLP